MVRTMRVVVGSLLMYVVFGATAHAEGPRTVHPGPQPVPPVEVTEPLLPQRLDGRRAVRGCSVEDVCERPGAALREIEVELFPRPGGGPWIDERTPPRSRLEAPALRRVQRPSELRPDQPWLDKVELPDLPVRWTQKLVDYLVFYKNDPRGRSIISSWLRSQGRYRDLILTHLRKAGLPEDLLYVSMIESSYNPNTLSRAGALGLWQFMPDGARIYGLRVDRWVDERRDPLRSTIAVMDYFADLYQRFGDWPTALAAFNAGYGAMLRSIARYNTNDYYALCEYENGLPWETCLYTPKVLATAIVGHNRALFGFDELEIEPPETWDEIRVPKSLTLATIARAAGATEDEIKRLNPHLRRGRTPPGEAGYLVRVPAGTREQVERRLVDLQSEWDGYDAYVVAHGERFEDIATTYGISRSALRKLNGVEHESEISGGTVLVVPKISPDERAKNQAKAKALLLGSGVDHKEGEKLIVPVLDKDFTIQGKRRVFYRVVTGDTIKSVAHALGVRNGELASWNGLERGANLHPRMVLVAWVDRDFDEKARRVALLPEDELIVVTRGSDEHLDAAEERVGRERIEYVAARTEKLADVAKKFGMTSYDLARINRISAATTLEKGDKVIVYKVVDPKRSERAEEQWKKIPRPKKAKPKKKDKRVAAAEPAEAPETKKSEARPAAAKSAEKPAPKKVAEAKPVAKPERKSVEPKPEVKPEAEANDEPVTRAAQQAKEPRRSTTPKPRATEEPAKAASGAPAEELSGPVTSPTQLD